MRSRSHRNLVLVLLMGIAMAFRGGGESVAANPSSPWGADYFPNITLVSHEGKKLRFFDDLIKGKVVAINFIFTRCPDACPLETAWLLEVQKILGDRVGHDVFFYSISIDPEHDTPEVLKQFVEKYQIGPGWLFLTGDKAEVTLLRKKLGLYSEEDESGNLRAHSLSFIIGNQSTGQWMKSSPFENPYLVATQIGSWLHNWKMPPRDDRDYAHAPEVRRISKGESLFRTRCAACHTIGAKPATGRERAPIGPDLLDVHQRRERAWLTRFLAEPDKVLAEKDPVAMALLAEYNHLPMPNLQLNGVEIEALLSYIEAESHRVMEQRDKTEDVGEKRELTGERHFQGER